MKKLIIAAAIVCAAALSQAATVNWSSGAVLADSGDGTGWGSGKITKSSSDYTMTVLVFSAYDATDGLSGQIGTGSKIGTNGKNNLIGASTTTGDLVSGTKYYLQATIENSANKSQLVSQILEFTWDGSMEDPTIAFMTEAPGTGVASLTSKNGTFSSTTGYWSAAGWTSSAVPEPTSGLLMLLGVAGLALRRRRA